MSRTVITNLEPRHLVVIATDRKTVVYAKAAMGPPGPKGDAGAGYEFTQSSPLDEWVINHNLGYWPSVEILSTGGVEIMGAVQHMSVNQVRVSFVLPTSGKARMV